jgi:alcohol dehydrogenase (cytochrome c)
MTLKQTLLAAALLIAPLSLDAQDNGLNPSDILKPLSDSWPTYNGDYTGKRYSALKEVDRTNVQHLTLAWMTQVTPGMGESDQTGRRRRRRSAPVIVGGEGPGDIAIRGGTIKASALEVDGTLYFTTPDNAWAIDARDGHELWHYFWKTKGGTHIGNRGLGMWNGYLFMETPDDYLVSLDAKTGKERWHKQFADVDQGYFSTPAPVVIGNHVLVGTGNDIDSPGFLDSFDPETGELQWSTIRCRWKREISVLTPGRAWTPRGMAAHRHGWREPMIRKRNSIFSGRETPRLRSQTERAALATTFSLAL